MTIYVGSDFHWGHARILEFCKTQRSRFNDVQHMNEMMVQEWNATVQTTDTVYMLGDVSFLNAKKSASYVSRCNGRKILIQGNHDENLLKYQSFRNCFDEVYAYHEIVHNGYKIVMCHYPIFDHNAAGRGSIMLHGHRHGNPHNIPGRIMDVGMDATGSIVTDLDSIVSRMEHVQPLWHH